MWWTGGLYRFGLVWQGIGFQGAGGIITIFFVSDHNSSAFKGLEGLAQGGMPGCCGRIKLQTLCPSYRNRDSDEERNVRVSTSTE